MARGATGLLALLLLGASAAPAQQPPLEVSENPVRGDSVVLSWPAATGDARVSIFTFTGERLHQATIAAPGTEYVWDLTVGGGSRGVVNGAYIVVVEVDGTRYRRRLFIARPSP
jgi:hypothetical protein